MSIILPKVATKGVLSVEEALAQRRSIREFSFKPLSLEQVSQIFWSVYGINHPLGYRCTPSAGAIYSLEVYGEAINVEGLHPGLYGYKAEKYGEHSLYEIKRGDFRQALIEAAWNQDWMKSAPIVILIFGRPDKLARRYGNRAERYMWLEAGHAAQNLHLQAVALNLHSVPVAAFNDRLLQNLIGTTAQPIYLLPLGY